ncbi:sodium bile acid symporter family-domain-containing protein [Suillus subalutaceus]|uniref:sodium bile acid symporter family-domain-containing protein n=1 Tax=Suillus subalutaceus TaxID=48586 RepID=UPI001B860B39|nr:sodium bile acid symporter family-domain-containing protein [Suillus subalutaceus]KAG1850348.1 sodium bile acid symporter family-domain-containing protein [Suillus subalutaceus]
MEKEESVVKKSNEQPSRPTESLTDHTTSENGHHDLAAPQALFQKLSILDRLLTPAILVCMVVGVVIGEFVPGVQQAFDTVKFDSVSVPIAIGLIVMMWPILTKVKYEALSRILLSRRLWMHMGISMILNWIIGPLIMLGLAWATLPDLPTYRTGVILVGLARCIAMVMVWNQLAGGDGEYCAILVVVNSVLQIILYSPYAVLFVNVVGHTEQGVHLAYGSVAISVLIYLGIPLLAGVITRFTVIRLKSKEFFDKTFAPRFSPLSLIGLLYTIIVMFAYQGHHIVQNLGPVFRVFVPMILYFVIMWTSAFALVFFLARREFRKKNTDSGDFSYELAVVQAFTAGSNNFELAIAVAIAVYGVGSDQALAATIGPLVEVPVLLALTWVAQYLRIKLQWGPPVQRRNVKV